MTEIRPVQAVTVIRPTVVATTVESNPGVTHVVTSSPITEVTPGCACSACSGEGVPEGGDLALTYDGDGLLVEVDDAILGTTTLTYNGDGLLVEVVGVDSTLTLEYDLDDRLVAVLTS